MARAPKALWGLNISYFLEGAAYWGVVTELVLYFKENVGTTEHHASLVVGLFTCGITVSQLFLGSRADKWGVRKAMWLSVGMLALARIILAVGDQLWPGGAGIGSPLFFNGIFALAVVAAAYGMYQPSAYAAVKQLTDKKTAAMGYAVLYGLMNLGGFFIGLISPPIRKSAETLLPPNGISAVLWACAGAVMLALVPLFFLFNRKYIAQAKAELAREAPAKEEEAEARPEQPTRPLWDLPFGLSVTGASFGTIYLLDFIVEQPLERWAQFPRMQTGNAKLDLVLRVAIFLALLAPLLALLLKRRPDHPFNNGRFVFFIFILIPVQTLFAHTWLTIPYYAKHAYAGFVSKNYELISNLNPLLIFFLAPLVAALTARANVYRMMVLGSLVMAAPTFLLAIAPHPALLFTYIAVMSIGEAMWQPRFLQYIAEIAPEGQTGIYMGIGQFPWFLTKMVTAFYAGWFLNKYMPEKATHDTETMWFIYACIAMITPICLWLFRKWAGAGKGMGKPQTAP